MYVIFNRPLFNRLKFNKSKFNYLPLTFYAMISARTQNKSIRLWAVDNRVIQNIREVMPIEGK